MIRMALSLLRHVLSGEDVLELDRWFMSVYEGNKRYEALAEKEGLEVLVALCRDGGNVARFKTKIIPGHEATPEYFGDWAAQRLTHFGARKLMWEGDNLAGKLLNDAFLAEDAPYVWMANELLKKTYGGFDIEKAEWGLPQERNIAGKLCGLELAAGTYMGIDIGRSNIRISVIEVDDQQNITLKYMNDERWAPDKDGKGEDEVKKIEQMVAKAHEAVGVERMDGYAGGSAGVFKENRMMIGNLMKKLGEGVFNGALDHLDHKYNTEILWLHDGTVMALEGNVLVPQLGSTLGIALGNDEGSGLVDANGVPFRSPTENAFHRINRNPYGFSHPPDQPGGAAGSICSQKGPINLYFENGGSWAELAQFGVGEGAEKRDIYLAIRDILTYGSADRKEFVEKIADTVGAELGYGIPLRLDMCPTGTNVLLGGKVLEDAFGERVFNAAQNVFSRYQGDFADSKIYRLDSPQFGSMIDAKTKEAFELQGKTISDFGQAYAAAVLASRIAATK